MKIYHCAATLVAALLLACGTNASASTMLIGPGIGQGNGDFNYEGGGATIPGTLTPNENIPRDRYLVSTGTTGQGVDVEAWQVIRVAYSGGNSALGLDGNFGFDAASFEPANTGSGQAFINGNVNSVADLVADTINHSGNPGDVFDLSYLLGSDSTGGTSEVTLTLDSGLGSEQSITYGVQSRNGTDRDAAHTVTEQYISTGAYSTVDLTLRMQNANGSTRTLIDDVRLSVVPEPATAMLLSLAICGFGLASTRRR